jgi:hypothetical protein
MYMSECVCVCVCVVQITKYLIVNFNILVLRHFPQHPILAPLIYVRHTYGNTKCHVQIKQVKLSVNMF